MAFTLEEKLAKLKQHPNWWSFTDAQRQFLAYVAEGDELIDAAKKAYPQCKNVVVMLKSMFARVGIQKALDAIGVDVEKADVTKTEALKMLSRHLRKTTTDAALLVKLLTLYSKLQGWDKEDESDPEEEVSLDKLVAAMEKKRKKV